MAPGLRWPAPDSPGRRASTLESGARFRRHRRRRAVLLPHAMSPSAAHGGQRQHSIDPSGAGLRDSGVVQQATAQRRWTGWRRIERQTRSTARIGERRRQVEGDRHGSQRAQSHRHVSAGGEVGSYLTARTACSRWPFLPCDQPPSPSPTMRTTTLPLARPVSRCANASRISANGKTRSTTTSSLPASTSPASSSSSGPLGCMKR